MNWHLLPIADYERYADYWDRLNQQTSDTPLLSSQFVQPLIDSFATGKEQLAIYGKPDAPQAMTILTKRNFLVWETWQPSQAPIGLWLQQKTPTTAELMQNLLLALPFTALLLGITQQDPDLLPRPPLQNKLSTLDYIRTARVSLTGTFEEYWAKRGKNLRQNLRRQRNRLKRENISVQLSMLTEPEQIEQAIIDYGRLESAGWKNEGGTAINIDNMQGRFYKDMLVNFCHQRRGIVFQYFYNTELVATDLCIRDNTTLIILKTTYDESITTSSPAMLMRQDAFEHIFNEKQVDAIEFYGKVMNWHTKWTDEIRTMFHVNRYRICKF